ncbi:MAG: hypothetical protein LQ345_004588 [Seirophora villosa]|nr:MAG: hypothetical protein LQ345_004588 [Seirophora villosa]
MAARTSLKLFLSSLLLHQCTAAICHPPRGSSLPLVSHCTEVVDSILDVSSLPRWAGAKEWGRQLANTPTTVHLPKTYWISGAGPRTCAVEIDVDRHTPDAIEKFGLGDLGLAAQHILIACLLRKAEVGAERVGAGRRVEVRLVRVDKEFLRTAVPADERISGAGSRRFLRSSELSVTGALMNQSSIEN